jgi:thioredoxin-like negative regulator of GroEL
VRCAADFHAQTAALPPYALLVLFFHTPWAAPCAHAAAVLDRLAARHPVYEPPLTRWLALDADECVAVVEACGVAAVPAIVLVKGGRILRQVRGYDALNVGEAIEQLVGK